LSVTTSKEVESVMRKPAAETAAPAAVVAK
jgi:hypothetical protein